MTMTLVDYRFTYQYKKKHITPINQTILLIDCFVKIVNNEEKSCKVLLVMIIG